VGENHVTACWGRDYSDVAPVAGIILGGHDHVVDVGVDVIPVAQAQLPNIAPDSAPG
jgi:transglutaminase-like putative cysteine protease